ncbi:MAG: nucleoside kinase, partial [Treponema sp.]|nr:nucleoside kinase [Treponema sp.]
MQHDIRVLIPTANGEAAITCPAGTIIETLAERFGALSSPLAAVKANNEILPLSAPLEINARLEPVLLESHDGASIYRHSLAFLLAVAARELFPSRGLTIGHSLGHGYY